MMWPVCPLCVSHYSRVAAIIHSKLNIRPCRRSDEFPLIVDKLLLVQRSANHSLMRSQNDMEILASVEKTSTKYPNSTFSLSYNPENHDDGRGQSSLKSIRSLTYNQAWRAIQDHKKFLQRTIRRHAAATDDDIVVAYLSSNSIDFYLSLLSSTSTELSSKPALLNTRWTPREMCKALELKESSTDKNKARRMSATTIILHSPAFRDQAHQTASLLSHSVYCLPVPRLSDRFSTIYTSFDQIPFPDMKHHLPTRRLPSDTFRSPQQFSQKDAAIVFTSGTTGGSKGVRLSHRALLIQAYEKCNDPCGYSSLSKTLATTVPLFHVGGLSSCLATSLAGGCLVLPEQSSKISGFNVDLTRAAIDRNLVNTLVVVPAMLVSLFGSLPSEPKEQYPEMRLILIGGQSATPAMISKLSSIFPNARIVQTYACTEAASSLTFLRLDNDDDSRNMIKSKEAIAREMNKRGLSGDCVGYTPKHVHLRLLVKNSEDGSIQDVSGKPYSPGVIVTKGPHLLNGYWRRGAETQPTAGEWFWTNDLAFYDPYGKLYFCGRVKDTIRTGGETVMAQEVERVLLEHPEIVECAVFPKQDARFGEAVACVIVMRQNIKPLSMESLKSWCAQKGLASYKRPRYAFSVSELPRNSSGKVLKFKLIQTLGKNLTSKL